MEVKREARSENPTGDPEGWPLLMSSGLAHGQAVVIGHPNHQSPPPPATRGRTLLPRPVAGIVSTALNTTGAAIRVGTWMGGLYISTGKYVFTKSVSGAQYMIRGAFSIAAGELASGSTSSLLLLESDHLFAQTLSDLHYNLTKAAFWTIVGLNASQGSLEAAGNLAVTVLGYLDNFFGSTDSSRAVASIVDMISREFRNPATGSPGERVDPGLLCVSLCSLAYLQNHCSMRQEEREFRALLEEVLWDVVVLNDGTRVDVEGLHVTDHYGPLGHTASQSMLVDTIERHGAADSQDEDDAPEMALKSQILRSLPSNASVQIATTTKVTKTIAVEVSGTDALPFEPPPGAEIVEQIRVDPPSPSSDTPNSGEDHLPTFRVVYQFEKLSVGNAKIEGHGAYQGPMSGVVEDVTDMDLEGEQDTMDMPEAPPEVPPKSPTYVRRFCTPPPPEMPTDDSDTPTSTRRTRTTPSSPTTSRRGLRQQNPWAAKAQMTSRGRGPSFSKPTTASKSKAEATRMSLDIGDRKSGFRAALRRGPGSAISTLLHKDSTSGKAPERTSTAKKTPQIDAPKQVLCNSRLPIPKRTSSASRFAPSSQNKSARKPAGRDAGPYDPLDAAGPSRPTSRASYISVHETKRDSMVSQTDTWSIHSRDGPGDDLRPLSPALVRKEVATHGATVRNEASGYQTPGDQTPTGDFSPVKPPSFSTIYTLGSRGSSTSLTVPSYQRSPFQDAGTIRKLQRTGMINEIFPKFHLLRNVVRYMRFSSATYGSIFLSTMGIGKGLEKVWEAEGNLELNVFAHHTDIPRKDILVASFVDTQGGTDASGSTNTNIPLVHYVSVDHESKAIILACRGTMGFEDVLTDLMCEYDKMVWQRRPYMVHKGIHASARRILYGRDGRVLMQLKQALEQYQEYGLVLTGHSLGGSVTALLGIMLAEPSPMGVGFVTSSQPHQRLLGDGTTVDTTKEQIYLPAGRPIHVYAYGPPGTMAPKLQKATRGLITSIVHGNDLVPYLSLGVLHDLQCVGLAFKSEAGGLVKDEFVSRVWNSCHAGLSRVWYGTPTYDTREGELRGDQKAIAALKTLRASMTNSKLVPPGEVFAVETSKVLRRDAYVIDNSAAHVGRMATRVVFKYVKDVEQRFKEIRFGMHMLVDHSPARYEDALNRLHSGVSGPGKH